ncbi:MAG: hypothetical protein RMN25_08335 [Anaerolineae bacterium]|nr:hypothetical protein [Thermoflexales bacterium]MDW8407781.1 hypothetical protein [Anaerolineae bacterium]
MKNSAGIYRPSPWRYVLCYTVWIILAGITIWLGQQVRVNLIQHPLPFSGINYWVVGAINQVSFFVSGLLTLIGILVMEHYLRRGIEKQKFWPRVARVIVILAVLLGASYVANRIMLSIFLD